MDFWNILQKLKKCKNLTKSALGGVPLQKLIVVQNHVVFGSLRCPQPTHNGMIVCYMVPNQTESAARLCSNT